MALMKKGKHAAHAQQIDAAKEAVSEEPVVEAEGVQETIEEANVEDQDSAGAGLEGAAEELGESDVPSEDAAADDGGSSDDIEGASPSAGWVPINADPNAPITIDGVVLHKKRRAGKVVGITFGIIIGVLLIAYIVGAVVFMGRFFPNTSIAGHDISMMPNEEVVQLLDGAADDYTIDVVGTEFNFHATAKDIGLSIDSQAVVDAMHADLNAWAWPVLLAQESHDESAQLAVKYDTTKYDYKVVNAVSTFNQNAVAPVDATISYDADKKKFVIVDEVPGTQYDSHVILAAMGDAISSLEPRIKLTSDYLIQPNVFHDDERLVNSAEMATGLISANITLTMGGQNAAVINGDNLSSFIRLDDNLGVTLDEDALNQWVTDLSNGFDTVGTERTYTRPDGKEITVSGGAYGWITDADGLKDQVIEAIKGGQTTTIDIPCEQTAAVYNGPGQPDWGNRYIDVDLSEQYVRFYGDDGSIIWETACVSGTPDGQHNTWPGVWYITNKESPSKLIGYLPNGQKEYETTVQYWMAFEGNGIGLHDATWQPDFGGSMYMNGYGSHGCVNISYSAAESLYSICEWGDVVIAHY